MEVSAQEEVEQAAVDPDGHAQIDLPRRRRRLADPLQAPTHPRRRPRGPRRVVLPIEQQQDGVASPLDQPGAVLVGDREELGEGRVQDVVELFEAHLPLAGEALGHLGESGDIDECDRACDLAEGDVWRIP